MEATAAQTSTAVHDSIAIDTRVLLRRPSRLLLNRVGIDDEPIIFKHNRMEVNVPEEKSFSDAPTYSPDEPYWLKHSHGGLFAINDPSTIGSAVQPQNLSGRFTLIGGNYIQRKVPVMYKWVDRVAGERIRPVYVTPVASLTPSTEVLIATGGPQTITVEVEALTDDLTGHLTATAPTGWTFADASRPLTIEMPGGAIASVGKVPLQENQTVASVYVAKRNERVSFTFQLTPTEKAQAGPVAFSFTGPKGKADRTLHEIDYPHIMPQVYYTPAEVKLVPLDVRTTAKTVGYIKGAGDDVPQAIEQLGVKVEFVDPATATLESLKSYDAIVTGIRAYNTTKALKDLNPLLMQYVEQGGTLVVQYNTKSSDMVLPDTLFGPYPFSLTRDRVTVEEAPPTFLAKDHALLNTPNKITEKDFEGWVQERGLYFCGKLDPHYTPLIAWNDPGEQPLNGGLITCDFGKGMA